MTVFACLILALAGSFPAFVPPPDGAGDEILPLNPRSFGMGGICAGIPDSIHFSILNPAASAWTTSSGICFGGRYSDGNVESWNNRLGFPIISAILPLPGRIVVTGAITGRSRIAAEMDREFSDFSGTLTWSGGLVESYAGISVLATDWLAVSVGGRCTFGNVISDALLIPDDPSLYPTKDIEYRDDADLQQAWGGVFGLMVNTSRLGLGFSISTDREGTVDVLRDYVYYDTDSSSQQYSIPGELSLGISYRPIQRILVGCDLFSRKALNLFDMKVEPGTVFSAGTEIDVGIGIAARAGFSYMDGLWRDGAQRVTTGLGYVFGGGRAGLDISAGYEFWKGSLDESLHETVFCVSLWATEKWLGE